MSIVKVDASNESNFKAKTIMPKGRYTFEVANDLVVTKAKNSSNNIVAVELRCVSEGEFRGNAVYDNLVLTPKTEWKLVHLAKACGISDSDIKNDGVDLAMIKGMTLEADIDVQAPSGGYREKNVVTRYVFEPTN